MFYVVLIILGLAVIVGVIFWMIMKNPGTRHSPSQSAVPRYELTVGPRASRG